MTEEWAVYRSDSARQDEPGALARVKPLVITGYGRKFGFFILHMEDRERNLYETTFRVEPDHQKAFEDALTRISVMPFEEVEQ